MHAIQINEHTQEFIAKTYNDGVVPALEEDSYYPRAYYLVQDDGDHEIVSGVDFAEMTREWSIVTITRPPRP